MLHFHCHLKLIASYEPVDNNNNNHFMQELSSLPLSLLLSFNGNCRRTCVCFLGYAQREREREVNARLQLHRLGPRAGGLLIRELQHQQQLCIAQQQLQSGIVACGVHDSCLIGPSHTAHCKQATTAVQISPSCQFHRQHISIKLCCAINKPPAGQRAYNSAHPSPRDQCCPQIELILTKAKFVINSVNQHW